MARGPKAVEIVRAAAGLLALACVAGCSSPGPCAHGTCLSDAGRPADAGGPDASVDAGDAGGTGDAGPPDAGFDGGPSCVEYPFVPVETRGAGYFQSLNGPFQVVDLVQVDGGSFDFLTFELRYFGNSVDPTFPYAVMLWPTTLSHCDVCVSMRRGCEASGQLCASASLAFGGGVTFFEATRDADAGVFRGAATTLRLLEWDPVQDQPTPSGACLLINAASFDAGWP